MLCSILTMLLLYLLAGLDMISSYTLFDIKMPNVSPKEDESYLCTGKKLPRTRDRYYAYKFEPNADEKTAHHMLVYACRSLSKRNRHNAYWKCHGTPCSGGQIIYAWAKNAEGLTLPKHVGFPLGDDFDLNYIVQQIHYARPLQDDEYDSSGVKIRLTKYEPQFVASIYLFASNFQIPPNSKGYNVDMACKYHGDSIKPFAFRTHAHKHGRSISAYRVRDGVWDQIGIGSPQRPQAFYPIKKEDRLLLKSNDLLVARCTFDTMNETKTIRAGSYSSDEMCNFYMMYYTMNKGEDFSVPSGCSSTTHTLDFPKDSMLPFQSSSTNTQPQTTPVASTVKPSTKKPEQKISSTPTDPHSKAVIITTKAPSSTHSGSSAHHSSGLPELNGSWSVEKELRSSFKGQIRSMDVTLNDNLVVLTGVRPANNSLFDGEHFLLESKPIEEKTIYIVNSNDGSFFNSFGASVFYLPSSVRVDHQGHFYVTDLGRHQVLKFDPSKKEFLQLVLGPEGIPGEDRSHFCSPADVVVDHKNHIYVADGLCNNRIVKFDANGKYLSEFGSGHLKHPQHLAISGHHIYVATQDRDQIYVFDFDGKFIRTMSHGLSTNEISMVYCHAKGSKDELLYIGGKNKVVAINLQKDSSIAWQIKGTGDKVLALSRDHRYLYIGVKDNGDIQRYLLPSSTSKNKGKNNFPWSPIDQIPSSTKPSTNNNSSRQVDILPKTPYDDDDITVIPAVVVVAVLATPIILVFVALIIQHVRLKHRVKRAAQKRTLDNYTKTGICTCCWSTPKYYYDSQKGFDRLVKGFNEDDDANEELSSSEEEDLFTRKA